MATRNPVSVLPEPVGEATSTSLPAAMWGQAADCGGVGPGREAAGEPARRRPGGRATRAQWSEERRAPSYSTRMV